MGKINDCDLEVILRTTLKADGAVEHMLNSKLRDIMSSPEACHKTVSVWWFPMAVSIIATFFTTYAALIFSSYLLVQAVIIMCSVSASCMSVILTLVGLKYFDLKKGALIGV